MNKMKLVNDPDYLARLNQWVEAEKTSAIPYIVRANYYYDTGWAVRGSDFMDKISADNQKAFEEYMKKSWTDLNQSIAIDDHNPNAYLILLRITGSVGDDKLRDKIFQTAIAKFPDYYVLYDERLLQLAPKWGGSIKEMLDFTNKYAEGMPEKSQKKFLYLTLYHSLAGDIHTNCTDKSGKEDQSCEKKIDAFLTNGMDKQITEALKLYQSTNAFSFNDNLFEKLACNCVSAPYNKKLLDLALATIGEHNYAIDEGYGNYFAQIKDFQKALQYYDLAIEDMNKFSFPSDDDNSDRIAYLQIYKANAQTAIGDIYLNGDGAPKDYAEAVKWFEPGAKMGSSHGQRRLGYIYALGGYGVTKDDTKSAYWYKLAAANGDAISQDYLGVLYGDGRGVPQDWSQSYMWISLAADQGLAQAKQDLTMVAPHITPAQQATLKAQAKTLVQQAKQ
jgi:TPR repeat protein